MKLDPSKPPTTVDRLATPNEIIAAILLSPDIVEQFSAEIFSRHSAHPNDKTDLEFEFLFRENECADEDSILN